MIVRIENTTFHVLSNTKFTLSDARELQNYYGYEMHPLLGFKSVQLSDNIYRSQWERGEVTYETKLDR